MRTARIPWSKRSVARVGFLRREIGQRLGLRHVPKLDFYWDEVVDSGLRIESILDEIREEPDSESEGST